MIPHQKKLAVALGALILISGVFFVLTWQQEHRKPNISDSTNEPAAPSTSTNEAAVSTPAPNRWETPTYRVNEVISSTSSIQETGYKTMVNKYCNVTYTIPADWSVFGFLGESQLISPENERENTAWQEANRELIENAEGDAFLYPRNRSLYISCQKNTKAYLEHFFGFERSKNFEHIQHLADLFATDLFHAKDPSLALVNTMKVDDVNAYEISETSRVRDGTLRTHYSIVIEKEHVYEILLDDIEYDNLSDAVKKIIQSISFE
jgi:hypothetical protein